MTTIKKHRKILYRGKHVLDTGFTTGSESELSDENDDTLKKRLCFQLNELNQLTPHSSIIEKIPSVDEKSTSVTEKQLDESQILENQIQPAQIPPNEEVTQYPTLFEPENDSESEPEEIEHLKSPKKVQQGKRLAEYQRKFRAAGGKTKKPQSKSKRADLVFPVSRILKKIKHQLPHFRILEKSAVELTAIIEYLVAELLEISGDVALETNRKRINPRHIFLAIKKDPDFEKLLENTTLNESGVLPSYISEPVDIDQKKPKTKRIPGYKKAEEIQKNVQKTTKKTKKEKSEAKIQQGKRLAEFMRNKRAAQKEANINKSPAKTPSNEADKENEPLHTSPQIPHNFIISDSSTDESTDESFQASQHSTTDSDTTLKSLKDLSQYSPNSNKSKTSLSATSTPLKNVLNTRTNLSQ